MIVISTVPGIMAQMIWFPRVLFLFLLLLPVQARSWTPPPRGFEHGVVAADHPLASRAGLEVLRAGGNAVDAACAAAFALGVVNPAGSGIGGGGFMVVHSAAAGVSKEAAAPVVIDFREVAPAAASRDMYLKKGVKPDASRLGGLAVGVPGEVMGCAVAVKRFGKLPLARVLAPAITLATEGFPVGGHLAKSIQGKLGAMARFPALKRIFAPGGEALKLGQRMTRPGLARSLAALAKQGPKVFYQGWIAKEIVKAARASGGVLTTADLSRYKVKERIPLKASYRGHTVWSMPPPSSGGVAIIQVLNMLGRYPLKRMGHNSSNYLHHLTEALKHAFADRARHLGDPDFIKVPVARLTSAAYADQLAARILGFTQESERYGSPVTPARAAGRDRPGTSHLSVVDRAGNAVAMTTTINTGFGSMVVAGKTGIILNNQMDDFAARPGEPNAFGLIQGEGNAVAPGKRPLSSMSPTLVMKGGKPVMVAGASGGPTIITGTVQALLNHLDFGLDATACVSRSRVHHQWMPDRLVVETDLPRDVVFNLAGRGHLVRPIAHPFTAVQVVLVGKDGLLYGASDPRKMGTPAGY